MFEETDACTCLANYVVINRNGTAYYCRKCGVFCHGAGLGLWKIKKQPGGK